MLNNTMERKPSSNSDIFKIAEAYRARDYDVRRLTAEDPGPIKGVGYADEVYLLSPTNTEVVRSNGFLPFYLVLVRKGDQVYSLIGFNQKPGEESNSAKFNELDAVVRTELGFRGIDAGTNQTISRTFTEDDLQKVVDEYKELRYEVSELEPGVYSVRPTGKLVPSSEVNPEYASECQWYVTLILTGGTLDAEIGHLRLRRKKEWMAPHNELYEIIAKLGLQDCVVSTVP